MIAHMEPSTFGLQATVAGVELPEEWQALLTDQAAAEAFLLWNKAHVHGVLHEVQGLTNRRTAERTLYLAA